ncbi:MAG: sigma-70 family RNA polymerase sigma factor [Chloroflexi bacterium]|nr:sigma-70 family RNA polymerase sigma factor [Chloroflexota bacterium]
MTPNPKKLLEQARVFDQKALGYIYDQYSDALFAYAYKHVGRTQVAEDLVAETFKRFLTALERGGGPTDHLQAYLYRITHNLITDLYRNEPPPILDLDEDQLQGEEPGPTDVIASKQDAERIRRALKLITPEQRQVIVLKFLEGWSSPEIAHSLEKSLGSVKSLQHRGLAALQRILLESDKTTDSLD